MMPKDKKISKFMRPKTMLDQRFRYPRSSSRIIINNTMRGAVSGMSNVGYSGIQLINVKDLHQIQSTNEALLYKLMDDVESMIDNNDGYAKSYESRLIRIEDSVIQFNKQFKHNTDLMNKMFDFLDHTNKMQNELYINMKNMLVEQEDTISKQLITDKTEIRGKIMTEKDHVETFNPGIFAVENDLDIDVVLEIVKELRDKNQLEMIDDSDKIQNKIPEEFITDRDEIKQILLNNKIPNKIFNPGEFAIDNDLDIDAVLEVVEELRKEKHLVSAND